MKKEDLFNAISDINPKYIDEINLNVKPVKRHTSPALIAAAIALFVASPFIVNAATNGEFFSRIWGTAGRQDIPSHVEYIEDKGEEIPVVYPQQDFVDVDVERAEDMIGSNISYLNISTEVDDVTITILSAVRDNRSAIVEFTLEKEGGIDFLNYSQLDNESKGAWFSDESTFYFSIGSYNPGKIYVDLEMSTEEMLHCYYYVRESASLRMTIYQYPCTLGELNAYSMADDQAALAEINDNTERSTIQIPCDSVIDSVEFVNPDGGILNISPVSMVVYSSTGLGLTYSESRDPYQVYYVYIEYEDGSSYLVDEHNCHLHECDVEVANYSDSYAGFGDDVYYIFNRLVYVDSISTINVNGVEYTRVQ